MSTRSRRPAAFALDDPDTVVIEEKAKPKAEAFDVTLQPSATDLMTPIVAAVARPRSRFRWASLFWSAVGGLVAMGLAVAVTQFIEVLFRAQ